MADNVNRFGRYGPGLFLLGLLSGVGLGYVLFRGPVAAARSDSPAPSIATGPTDNSARRIARGSNFNPENRTRTGGGEPRQTQAFLEQMTPEQRAQLQSLRAQMRQNGGEWRNLTPEERRQRLRDQLNLTPEQEEQLQQRLQTMRERTRNRSPR